MLTQRIDASTILSPQKGGFLAGGFTHTLNAYNGCGFGATACGQYCYAQYMPNWIHGMGQERQWGHGIVVKQNAPELLHKELKRMKPEKRNELRIFMSTTTDPYQPMEFAEELTRKLLEVFVEFPDLGLLVIQTRSNLVTRDMPIIQKIPYAWVSMTIETDRDDLLKAIGSGGISIEKRFEAVKKLSNHGINTQIAVSPCLPYSSIFTTNLSFSGAKRIIVDSLVDGDGARGERTARSPIALKGKMLKETFGWNWRDDSHAKALHKELETITEFMAFSTGWSDEGFCGIPSQHLPKQKEMFSE